MSWLTKSSEPFFSVIQVWLSLLTMTLYEVTQSLLSVWGKEEISHQTESNTKEVTVRTSLSTRPDTFNSHRVKVRFKIAQLERKSNHRIITWACYRLKFCNKTKIEVCHADVFFILTGWVLVLDSRKRWPREHTESPFCFISFVDLIVWTNQKHWWLIRSLQPVQ